MWKVYNTCFYTNTIIVWQKEPISFVQRHMQQGFQAKATGRTSDIQDLNNITSMLWRPCRPSWRPLARTRGRAHATAVGIAFSWVPLSWPRWLARWWAPLTRSQLRTTAPWSSIPWRVAPRIASSWSSIPWRVTVRKAPPWTSPGWVVSSVPWPWRNATWPWMFTPPVIIGWSRTSRRGRPQISRVRSSSTTAGRYRSRPPPPVVRRICSPPVVGRIGSVPIRGVTRRAVPTPTIRWIAYRMMVCWQES